MSRDFIGSLEGRSFLQSPNRDRVTRGASGGPASMILVRLLVHGCWPWMFGGGGNPQDLPRIRYGSFRNRHEFTDGRFWERVFNIDRWNGASLSSDTSNMTTVEKASITDVLVAVRTQDSLRTNCTYQVGGAPGGANRRTGFVETKLLNDEPIDEYLGDVITALSGLNQYPTLAEGQAGSGDVDSSHPFREYYVNQAGPVFVKTWTVGRVLNDSGQFVSYLPPAFGRINYGPSVETPPPNWAGEINYGSPPFGIIHFSSNQFIILTVSKVRAPSSGIKRWVSIDTDGGGDYGLFTAREELSCDLFTGSGFIAAPDSGDWPANIQTRVAAAREFPGHVWPTSGLSQPINPSCL